MRRSASFGGISNKIISSQPTKDDGEAIRPLTLYFYTTQAAYNQIIEQSRIWRSGGAPVADGAHGNFPAGAYASSSTPQAVSTGMAQFRRQWYSDYDPGVLTHYVGFRNESGWAPLGHTAPGVVADPHHLARFGWHWVNETTPVRMRRGENEVDALHVTITAHGPIPAPQVLPVAAAAAAAPGP